MRGQPGRPASGPSRRRPAADRCCRQAELAAPATIYGVVQKAGPVAFLTRNRPHGRKQVRVGASEFVAGRGRGGGTWLVPSPRGAGANRAKLRTV